MKREPVVAAGAQAHHRLLATADNFCGHFRDRGYSLLRPQPTLPESDNTILFTNSAVVPFKPLIRHPERIDCRGGYLIQPCIRAHNLDKTFTAEFHPEFLLAFSMLGVIAPASRLASLAADATAFLAGLNLTEAGIYRVLSADADLVSARSDLPAELNSRKRSYYRWSFGDPRMTGRGSTYAALNSAVGSRDLGNLIAFEWDGRTVAYGFGVGLESVQSCRDGVNEVVLLTPAGATLGPETIPEMKYSDLIGLLVRLLHAGVRLSSRGHGHVARQAALSVVNLAGQIGRRPTDIVRDLIVVAAAQGITLQHVAAADYVERFAAKATNELMRTAHLSFLVPDGVTLELVQENLAFECDAAVIDSVVHIVDRYAGPGLPTGTRSVTFAVNLVIGSGTSFNDVLAAGAARASRTGARLRGSLP